MQPFIGTSGQSRGAGACGDCVHIVYALTECTSAVVFAWWWLNEPKHVAEFLIFSFDYRGPGSVIGIATAYVLDGPGIESWWGEIFRTSPDRPWGPPSLLYNEYRVFPGGKVLPGRDADPSPPSSAEV